MEENLKQEQMSSVEKLKDYAQKGFLFHGSSNGEIEKLEPRTATDTDPTRKFNNDTAVFATPDACTAAIFAVVNKSKLVRSTGRRSWSTSWNSSENGMIVTATIPKEWKEDTENNVGYVYVLPSETFTESNGSQRKSKVEVKPIDRVEVKLQDYLDFGGFVNWD